MKRKYDVTVFFKGKRTVTVYSENPREAMNQGNAQAIAQLHQEHNQSIIITNSTWVDDLNREGGTAA